MRQKAEKLPSLLMGIKYKALKRLRAPKLKQLVTLPAAILHAFLTLIYMFFMLYSPVTVTLDYVSL